MRPVTVVVPYPVAVMVTEKDVELPPSTSYAQVFGHPVSVHEESDACCAAPVSVTSQMGAPVLWSVTMRIGGIIL
jgi:hypothetical protein